MSRTGRTDKHPAFRFWSDDPVNGEPPLELLRRSLETPVDLFYVRCHGTVPAVDEADYRLVIDGDVEHPLELGLADIRERFSATTATAALECAGNRRNQLMEVAEIRGETPWREGAIGNARWTGARLRDVLEAAGVGQEARHVALLGLDRSGEGGGTRFGASIPLAKALSGETLLAYAMNGAPLPRVHGFPLRAVVPGYIAARSVKWLARITLQREPSDNYFQARSYKLFPVDVRTDDADWGSATTLTELAVNSAICRIAPDGRGAIVAEGWAVGGGDHTVKRVEVSADGGGSWREARLCGMRTPWVWTFWSARLEPASGRRELVVRAWDSAGTGQPDSAAALWNFKGYANNAWHRVSLAAE